MHANDLSRNLPIELMTRVIRDHRVRREHVCEYPTCKYVKFAEGIFLSFVLLGAARNI